MTDTDDLRSGPPLHDALLALLPLVGTWTGGGNGVVASSGLEFAFGQQVSITHDGRPFLAYASRSWLVDAAGATVRLAWRENGFWRPGGGPDDIELVVASNTGQALMFTRAPPVTRPGNSRRRRPSIPRRRKRSTRESSGSTRCAPPS